MNAERLLLPPLTDEEREAYRMPTERDFYDQADIDYERDRQEELDGAPEPTQTN